MKYGKKNGNNLQTGNGCYYVGLDIGTNSVGWAATDSDYGLLKYKGKSMWGSRLFEEAKSAQDRRGYRTARRRLQRQQYRLKILEDIFNDEIAKVDPTFFLRLKESNLCFEDRTVKSKYPLFNDENYTDKDYMRKPPDEASEKYPKGYPTAYHLRKELISSKEPHDVRLVFLALHHILKSRGHFLFEGDGEPEKTEDALAELNGTLEDIYGVSFGEKTEKLTEILENAKKRIGEKEKEIKDLTVGQAEEKTDEDRQTVNLQKLACFIAGKKVKFSDIFNKEDDKDGVSLKEDIGEKIEKLSEDEQEVILKAQRVYNAVVLGKMCNGKEYISVAKVDQFDVNEKDLKKLKLYVKENCLEKYKKIFCEKGKVEESEDGNGERSGKKKSLNNFAEYSRRTVESGESTCTQEDFCNFLKKELKDMKDDPGYKDIWAKIEDGTFYTKLKGTENGSIPYQLHRSELKKILENASEYLDFLNEKDSDGYTAKEKIESTFEFKIPYFVGPLYRQEGNSNAWIEKKSGKENRKILPWTFDEVVDKEKCMDSFMKNLIGKCTYTGEQVLPKESLLYSEFMLLNTLNGVKVQGKKLGEINVNAKEELIEELFKNGNKKVGRKEIANFISGKYGIENVTSEDVEGIDGTVKTKLVSYNDFRGFIKSGKLSTDEVEDIIERITVFGDEKKMLRKKLTEDFKTLTADEVQKISRLKYKDWGNLSKKFLAGIKAEEDGEQVCIIGKLRSTDFTLMELLNGENERKYHFAEQSRKIKQTAEEDLTVNEIVDGMYASPVLKRSIKQALRIVDEIADIRKGAPAKIFVETARGGGEKGKREDSRKDKLIKLYETCREDSEMFNQVVYDRLQGESDRNLRKDALYLYYTQFGKCMYTGEIIDITQLNNTDYCDIDHIYARSIIRDDSIENRVLVKSGVNRTKGNKNLDPAIRIKMRDYWKALKEKGLIGEKKFQRLMKDINDEDTEKFVNRQLTATQQSTKYVIELLKLLYPNTEIVYSKAGNVSEFRQKFDLLKCRDVNDLHHAKDAYLNIVVGNVYNVKFTKNWRRGNEYSLKTETVFGKNESSIIKGVWNGEETLEKVKNTVRKNDVLVTRMAHETKGQLYKVTVKPKGKGQLETKRGRDREKYGGYDKIAGAYFTAVEHTDKNKRTVTLEPVYIYNKSLYEKDPEKYCREVLGLCEPKILCKKILMHSLLELDGKKMYVTGRQGKQIIGSHPYQLVLKYEDEKYIKRMIEFIGINGKNTGEPIQKLEFDEKTREHAPVITKEKNIALYNLFLEKLQNNVYGKWLEPIFKTCEKGQETFGELNELEQSKVLEQILNTFKCNTVTANLNGIGGAKITGKIRPTKTLSNGKGKTAYLINQSVTGLFEEKVDLLKAREEAAR